MTMQIDEIKFQRLKNEIKECEVCSLGYYCGEHLRKMTTLIVEAFPNCSAEHAEDVALMFWFTVLRKK